jgi:hypothetical protein
VFGPIGNFSWQRLRAALRRLSEQLTLGAESEFPRELVMERMPYIEIMLPVTGVVAPIWKYQIKSQSDGSRRH